MLINYPQLKQIYIKECNLPCDLLSVQTHQTELQSWYWYLILKSLSTDSGLSLIYK